MCVYDALTISQKTHVMLPVSSLKTNDLPEVALSDTVAESTIPVNTHTHTHTHTHTQMNKIFDNTHEGIDVLNEQKQLYHHLAHLKCKKGVDDLLCA